MSGPTPTPPPHRWHAMPSAEVLALTGTDAALGLDRAECQARLHRHGANSLPEPPPHPLWRRFARQFWSPLIGMLFIAAVLAVGLPLKLNILVGIVAAVALCLLLEKHVDRVSEADAP